MSYSVENIVIMFSKADLMSIIDCIPDEEHWKEIREKLESALTNSETKWYEKTMEEN